MATGYKLLPLTDVQPGMVLSDVLLDRLGHVLLAKGAVLTVASIASLGRHGIGMLPVVTEEMPAPPDADQVQARLDHLFRHNQRDDEADWATGVLRRFVEDYRLAREVAP